MKKKVSLLSRSNCYLICHNDLYAIIPAGLVPTPTKEVIAMGTQRKRPELLECAEGLRVLSLNSSLDEMENLIDDGEFHLAELRGRAVCNPLQENSLDQRTERARDLRDQKLRQAAGVFREMGR